MKVNVYIIRHGETAYNRDKVIQGHLDVELNELGGYQAEITGEHLARSGIRFDRCWTSDLKRASKTGELILAKLQNPGVELLRDTRLRERFLGNLQGKTWPADTNDPTVETSSEFLERIFSFWHELFPSSPSQPSPLSDLPEANSRPINIALFTHGGNVRLLTVGGLVHELRYSLEPPLTQENLTKRAGNCCITEVLMEGGEGASWKGKVIRYADDGHLPLEAETGESADTVVTLAG